MITTASYITRLKALKIRNEAKQAIGKVDKKYIALQQEQMLHGRNAEGYRIGKYRSLSYAKYKSNKNSLPGMWNVDLIDTGAFINSLELDIQGNGILKVVADDPNGLEKRYKSNGSIFGLEDKSKQEFIDVLRPVFVNQIKAKL